MELVAEAKTLIVHMKCDKCNNGLMVQDGYTILASDPPQYPHKCNNCGYYKNYFIQYPYQRMVLLEKLREPIGKEICQ